MEAPTREESHGKYNTAMATVPYLSEVDGVKKIYFFGSGAKNSAHRESDTDICVVARDDRALGMQTNLRGILYAEGFFPDQPNGVDLCAFSESTFNSGKQPFCETVKKEGILLWPRT